MQETQETVVPALGQENPLEEGRVTNSSTLAWRIPWTEEPWQRAIVHGVPESQTGLKWLSMDTVQFSHSVKSDSLRPHGLQHVRPPCPSQTTGVYPNSCPLSRWCHPTISSSVIPFSYQLQSFPEAGSFQMNQFFEWGGQSIGVSASTSALPINI